MCLGHQIKKKQTARSFNSGPDSAPGTLDITLRCRQVIELKRVSPKKKILIRANRSKRWMGCSVWRPGCRDVRDYCGRSILTWCTWRYVRRSGSLRTLVCTIFHTLPQGLDCPEDEMRPEMKLQLKRSWKWGHPSCDGVFLSNVFSSKFLASIAVFPPTICAPHRAKLITSPQPGLLCPRFD